MIRAARRLRTRARGERGAVMIMTVGFFPVLVLLTSFVIDIGNWFEHNRHLQMQADAAVLAAAGEFATPCESVSNQAIKDMARDYGGLQPPADDTFNQQVGGTALEDVDIAFNSRTWPGQAAGPVDDTVVEGEPCDTGMIDVKLTERDLPWFFSAAQVDFINVQARVAIRRAVRAKGVLPIGVPDVKPKKAMAVFVDESKAPGDAGYVLKETALCKGATSGGLTAYSNAGAPDPCPSTVGPLPVRIDARDIGVRIVLSGSGSTTCGQPLVECYDAETGSKIGLSHIRGWTGGEATATNPRARDVELAGGTCPDGYFVDVSAGCTVKVIADVDFGVADPRTVDATLAAKVGNKSYPLTYIPPNPETGVKGYWESSPGSPVPVPAAGGTVTVDLKWGTKGVTNCNQRADLCTFTAVQRAFSGTAARSGPIRAVKVSEGVKSGTNSFKRCVDSADTTCVHDLVVTIGIDAARDGVAQGPDTPPVTLRLDSGNQTQALDCDVPGYDVELAEGCKIEYQVNTGEACPAGTTALRKGPEPYTCVGVETGSFTNKIAKGLNKRILGDEKPATCTKPNNWKSFFTDADTFGEVTSSELAGDPRTVQVFLTPFGAFSGSGGTTVPITEFATFYVTGWTAQGAGFANPCTGNGDDPTPGDGGGYIVGHFVKYIDRVNNGEAGDEMCDFDALQTCVAVLTR
jgi:hypothetical protein